MTALPAGGLVLDHLVVGAATLEQGTAYLRDRLGVTVPAGGTHPRMGTHNRLTRIAEGVFLEIIALDPHGVPPGRPRWFGLDEPAMQQRLAERPRPIAWLAGTRDIVAALAAAPELGRSQEMTRGSLTWSISIRDDGRQAEGVLPSLIQWPDGPHPAERMEDCGIRFAAVRVGHPNPSRILLQLDRIGAGHLVTIEPALEPGLCFDLYRPDGRLVTLA